MRYRILVLADHNWRDTPSLAAIRVYLERLIGDVDVRIVDIHLLPAVYEIFHPHIVIANHLHDGDRNRILDTIRRRGGLVVVNSTEGRVNSDGQMEWASKKFNLELCDLYLCWSDEFARHLPQSARRVVTGNPRIDNYFPPLNRLSRSKTELCSIYGLDKSKPIITVASSFPNAKFSQKNTQFLIDDWKKLGVSDIENRKDPVAFADGEKRAFDKFQSWLLALRREQPEWQMVIKPHPAEDVADWLQFADGIGAKLMLTDYIFNLFNMSDVHIARVDCLTLPEAWINEVPTVAVHFGETFTGSADEAQGAQGVTFGDVAGVIASVESILTVGESGAWYDDRKVYVEKWLGPMPGATERVAKAIAELLSEKKPVTWKEPTVEDYANLHKLLTDHSKQYAIPKPDHIGQFGKSVRLEDTDKWTNDIRSVLS